MGARTRTLAMIALASALTFAGAKAATAGVPPGQPGQEVVPVVVEVEVAVPRSRPAFW
jgi:hypothetical protein